MFPAGTRNSCLGYGAHLSTYVMCTTAGELFQAIKQPRREGGHIPPSSAEVKNVYCSTCTHMSSWEGA
jgi:hypothetical protein